MRLARYLDIALLMLALPVFLLTGLPLLGWGGIALAWCAQRWISAYTTRRAAASHDPRTVAGLLTGSMIGRAWLIALTIFGVGLAERKAGLAAAVLAILLLTIYIALQMTTRPFENRS